MRNQRLGLLGMACGWTLSVGLITPAPAQTQDEAMKSVNAPLRMPEKINSGDLENTCILTGGDPLMLSPRRLAHIGQRLSAMPHIAIIRLHSRVPVADPDRVRVTGRDRLQAQLVWFRSGYVEYRFPNRLPPMAHATIWRSSSTSPAGWAPTGARPTRSGCGTRSARCRRSTPA